VPVKTDKDEPVYRELGGFDYRVRAGFVLGKGAAPQPKGDTRRPR